MKKIESFYQKNSLKDLSNKVKKKKNLLMMLKELILYDFFIQIIKKEEKDQLNIKKIMNMNFDETDEI